jgi:hypothetical protein
MTYSNIQLSNDWRETHGWGQREESQTIAVRLFAIFAESERHAVSNGRCLVATVQGRSRTTRDTFH